MEHTSNITLSATLVVTILFSPATGKILALYPSSPEKIDMSLADAVGKPIQDLALWADEARMRQIFKKLEKCGRLAGEEIVCRGPLGEPWHARIHASINSSAEQHYAVLSIEDISESRRLEELLHRSEEFYRLLAECAGDVIWVLDVEGRFLYMSHAIRYRMGYEPDEVVGKSFEPLVTPDSASKAHALLKKVAAQVETGQRVGCKRIELELVRKNTSKFWGEVNFCGMYSARDEFIGLQGVSRDVTRRKLAEEAAHESVRMLTDLAQNLPGAAFQFFVLPDGSRGFHYLSPRAHLLFDLPLEWRMGLNVHPEDYGRFMESFNMAVETKSPWSFEGRFLLKSGETRWFHGLAQPSQKEKELIFNGVLLDITDRKQADEALQEANRRKDEFLAMLAHELRNPLAPMRNAVELMKLSPANEAVQGRQFARIEHQIRHMSRLIDDLLDVARITRGTMGLRKQVLDLRDVIAQVIENTMVLTGSRKNDFTCRMPEQPLLAEADFTRLVQAIGNLLDNALKFSDPGQRITLTATLEPAASPDHRPEVVIMVEDQGQGIPTELLPNIFDVFMQVDKSLDRTRGGLGLGLTLARRIILLHGGSIQAESPGLGKGSRFSARLPAVLDQGCPQQSTGQESQAQQALSVTEVQTKRRRILVVDDVIDEAQSLAELLELWGYTVDTAFDGLQAIEKFASFSPGIVLLDIGLPGLDGFAVAREIQKHVAQESLLLIIISGYNSEKDHLQSLQAGCQYHFSKPIDLDQLREILRRYAQAVF